MVEQTEITLEELRGTATYLNETILPIVVGYATVPVPIAIGNAQYFPRPSQSNLAAKEGSVALRESVVEVVKILNTLAHAQESGHPVPALLLEFVRPYVEAYRREG